MLIFLAAFSLFNACAALAAVAKALWLRTPDGRERWASQRLYAVVTVLAWTLPAVALAATALGWTEAPALILLPIAWLTLFGIVFAAVDVAEDGVLGNGLRPPRA